MRFKQNISDNQKNQKNRKYTDFNYKSNIGCWYHSYLISKKNINIEVYFFFFLKKVLKNFLKKNNSLLNIFFFWITLKLNFPMSKKSKNSRMGKGKGSFLRWVLRVGANSILLKAKLANKRRFEILFNNLKQVNFINISLKQKM